MIEFIKIVIDKVKGLWKMNGFEDFINTAAMLLIPFGPFILVILVAIPGVIIALLVKIIIKLIKMAKKRDN